MHLIASIINSSLILTIVFSEMLINLLKNNELLYNIVVNEVSTPTHRTGEFRVIWKDDEGDDVVVSSNGELQAALEECPGSPKSTLKLNVTGQ